MARDLPMDLQLQAELLSHLSRPLSPIIAEDVSVEFILASLKVRPLARAWALGKYEAGLELGNKFIKSVDKEWRTKFPFLLAAAYVWTASLSIMRGKKGDYEKAESHLQQAHSLLPEKEIDQPFATPFYPETILWYKKAIAALAHRVYGYLKRVQGFMKDAVNEYQKAAALLREINLRIEMATTMNDMGFAQAELGEWHNGRSNVVDALRLRRELGPRVPVALSINTLAAIDVREGQYLVACQNAERALAIFRAFSHGRGIGMVLTTLAEATRRHAGISLLLTVEERIKLLREARDYAHDANTNFAEKGEKSRQVEALIEVGCACRDLAWWIKRSSQAWDTPARLRRESQDALQEAARLAKDAGLIYRHVDALVNLAWLEFYVLEEDEKISENHAVWVAVEAAEKAFPSDTEMDKQPQVWAQKGKLHVLKGNLAYRRLKQQRIIEPKGISKIITASLEDEAKNYALGLDYSSRFAMDYQGIRRAKDTIFENLRRLNVAEMRVICRQVKILYPNNSPMQVFLINRALWFGD